MCYNISEFETILPQRSEDMQKNKSKKRKIYKLANIDYLGKNGTRMFKLDVVDVLNASTQILNVKTLILGYIVFHVKISEI